MSKPPQIRILFCHYTADPGGGSDRSLFDLVTRLSRDRFAPSMLLHPDDPLVPRYRLADIPVHTEPFVPPRRAADAAKLFRFASSLIPSVWRARRIIVRTGTDVVHVNTLYNIQGGLAAVLAGKPLVWHVREIESGSRVGRIFLACVARWAARAVAISYAVGETLAACGPRRRVVLNGIDPDRFAQLPDPSSIRRELGLEKSNRVVLCVGRIEPWKGQHVLIEAIPAVLRACPGAKFVFVGNPAVNKPDYLPRLEARCVELGIAGRVVFAGVRNDLPALLALAEVVAVPTATAEPFGRVIVEAMLAGRPVVATAAGGPLEIIENEETGRLVPPSDANALAAAIGKLLADPEAAAAMGQRARARALDGFTIDRTVREMAAIFEEVAASRGI